VTIRNAVLFMASGRATPLLLGQIRRRSPLQPFQSMAVLVDGGLPTKYFRDWWARAFPLRQPLPLEPIADAEGRGSDRFWELLN
jgi:hypothetical protein